MSNKSKIHTSRLLRYHNVWWELQYIYIYVHECTRNFAHEIKVESLFQRSNIKSVILMRHVIILMRHVIACLDMSRRKGQRYPHSFLQNFTSGLNPAEFYHIKILYNFFIYWDILVYEVSKERAHRDLNDEVKKFKLLLIIKKAVNLFFFLKTMENQLYFSHRDEIIPSRLIP